MDMLFYQPIKRINYEITIKQPIAQQRFALLRVLGLIQSLFCIFEIGNKSKVLAYFFRNSGKAAGR